MSFRRCGLAFVGGLLFALIPFTRLPAQQNSMDQQNAVGQRKAAGQQKPGEQPKPTEQANQGTPGQNTNPVGTLGKANAAPETGKTAAPTNNAQQAGMDRPPIVVRADGDEVETTIKLRGLDGKPAASDFELGRMAMPQHPNLVALPSLKLQGDPQQTGVGEFQTTFKIGGLGFFGDGDIPLLYKGRQVEILRFSKPGLIVKPPVGDSFVAREDQPLMIVLENPSGFVYDHVRARLRFGNTDVCLFTAQDSEPKTGGDPVAPDKNSTTSNRKEDVKKNAQVTCDQSSTWTEFKIPPYAQISLWASPSTNWFRDPATGFARSESLKGWLTLRFENFPQQQADAQQAPGAQSMEEQNLPLEVQFEPGEYSLVGSLVRVALWLLAGALLSMLLRVSVPNITRRSQLKDQLNDAGMSIATISSEVDSTLRVLLRVQRKTLDNLRVAVWSFGPGYADYATRVEQGLPKLNRRIDAARELDAALSRRKTMLESGAAPARVEQIEELLAATSETLKQDEISDEDWVLINQHLDAAQKLLREPNPTEKEAFDAMLSGRWKDIRDHFGRNSDGSLKVPDALKGLEECFPSTDLLPDKDKDPDATQWIKSVGAVRADLQLSALMLLREFQFLSPTPIAKQAPANPEGQTPPGSGAAEQGSGTEGTDLGTTSTVSGAEEAKGDTVPPSSGSNPQQSEAPAQSQGGDVPKGGNSFSQGAAERGSSSSVPGRIPMWADARRKLKALLSTPSIDNLREAKRELRQLADGVCEEDIKVALQMGKATIVMDPALARPDRTIRFSVRFRQPNLNTAAARQLVSCSWVFEDTPVAKSPRLKHAFDKVRQWVLGLAETSRTVQNILLPEDGWSVHHYFEKYIDTGKVSVCFYDSRARQIQLPPDQAWATREVKPESSRRGKEKWQRFSLELTQLGAALLIPLATLASTTVTGSTTGHWWQLVAIGFGSDTIKNILVNTDSGSQSSAGSTTR